LIFDKQISSKVKDASIFSTQMEAIVSFIPGIFFGTRAGLKIGEFYSGSLQLLLKNIQARDKFTFRLIVCERKYLMEYKPRYSGQSK